MAVDLSTLLATTQMKLIITLIAIDVLLGIIDALLRKDFRLGQVANFMFKPVLGYVFGYAIMSLLPKAQPTLALLAQMSYYLILLALVGSILDNLAGLGIKFPTMLRK